jgi:biotin-(acetyl-CoA carboxylase) ligase
MVFYGEAANPVSLKMVAGQDFVLSELLEKAVNCIEKRYDLLKLGHMQEIDRDYLKLLFRIGQLASYTYKEKKIEAKITGVNRYGYLILEIPGEKIIECDLKEIKFEI